MVKMLLRHFLSNKKVNYGYQYEKIDTTKIFIAPSTSGAANKFWDKNKWKELLNEKK